MSVWNISFSPVDSWLFKPALASDGLGARMLNSDFPPSRTTLVGALRSAIGEQLGVHWLDYRQGNQPDVERAIGRADQPHPEQANVAGPWLSLEGEQLMPWPLCFLARELEDGAMEVAQLEVSEQAFLTDMGKKHLPVLPRGLSGQGYRVRDDLWLKASRLQVLVYELKTRETIVLQPGEFFARRDLLITDDRLGIGMMRGCRIVNEGLLYQTQHVRLREDVQLMLQVSDWEEAEHADGSMVTLGADGRLAYVKVEKTEQDSWWQGVSDQRVMVSAPVPMQSDGLPQELEQVQVLSAATSKPLRRGGWNLKGHRSKPVSMWVAPGSVYWLEKGQTLKLSPEFYCFD